MATLLGAVISKFGTQIDKKISVNNIVNKKKKIESIGLNRLGVNTQGNFDDLKNEQTQMMVQNIFKSKPLLFRRYAPTKSLGAAAKKP